MKKLIYLFLLLLPFISYSQITVTSANLPDIGDTVIIASDYNPNYSAGNSGTNQIWDFSNAAGGLDMLLGFIDPAPTPYQANFPSSNLCVENDPGNYVYLNRSVDGLKIVGMVDSGMIYPYSMMLLPTPLEYLDTDSNTTIIFSEDSALVNSVPATLVFPGMQGVIDSVRYIIGNLTHYIVDGWGQLELPNGTFDALRVQENIYEFESLEYRVSSSTAQSQWVQDTSESSMQWEEGKYSWRTNDPTVTWSLVQMEIDSSGNSYGDIEYFLGNSITSIVVSPPMVDLDKLVDVSCNGDADGFIMLDIFGTATPLIFSWTGPNGFVSTSQDIFNLEPGTYEVNVTDANGNSAAETYIVNEPPSLTASINQSGSDLIANVNGGVSPYSYLWNTGPTDTLSTITPSSNGVYSCDVKDKLGCVTTVSFTVTNISTDILELDLEKKLIKITDILGRESKESQDGPLFYIYDNGTVEKRMIIE